MRYIRPVCEFLTSTSKYAYIIHLNRKISYFCEMLICIWLVYEYSQFMRVTSGWESKFVQSLKLNRT